MMLKSVAQILSWISVPYFQLFAAYFLLIAQDNILAWKTLACEIYQPL